MGDGCCPKSSSGDDVPEFAAFYADHVSARLLEIIEKRYAR